MTDLRVPGDSDLRSWVSLETYVNNLRRAGAGVVQVFFGPDGNVSCTGWLITNSLVVVPSSLLHDGLRTRVHCRLAMEDALVSGRVVFSPGEEQRDSDPQNMPALIRLEHDVPAPSQQLQIASPRSGEALLLLHFPMGTGILRVSQGHVVQVHLGEIDHDVASAPGSAGAPLIAAETGQVLGMHSGEWPSTVGGRAITLAAMLDSLVAASAWHEIAEHHRLAAVGPYTGPHGSPKPHLSASSRPALLSAALKWSIDPKALDADDREALRSRVADPAAQRWSLPASERRELIGAAGSLESLREAYRPAEEPGPADRALERLITGPMIDLASVPDEELPYLLPAVAWFEAVVPGLPEPAQVNRELQRRRLRARLLAVATERLWGREREARRLLRWAKRPEPPPFLVTGVGGIGKSALIARFVLDLPDGELILWLDFDRADLAPDNAVSVLAALIDQVALQRDGSQLPIPNSSNWQGVARKLGSVLSGERAVLVIDGFEVAQHAERQDELFGVLEAVLGSAPGTRVIVSGRAPVPDLELGGRRTETMQLPTLSAKAARAWLSDRGTLPAEMVDTVVQMTGGIPLLLKLALRFVETGGNVADLPTDLPRELVNGYLYQRIVDRVVDVRLRGLAHDALVLRRISPDVLTAVLDDRIPDGMTPETAIARLTRELALVEFLDVPQAGQRGSLNETATLRMRPEVRAATLRLLEIENEARVQQIDFRAAAWYARSTARSDDRDARLAAAAESVYHYVRAGEVGAAKAIWIEGCAELLRGASVDVPQRFPQARRWLTARVGLPTTTPGSLSGDLGSWEYSALNRIRNSLARGLDRNIPEILRERSDRSPDSALVVYDAWVARERGDFDAAEWLLQGAGELTGPAGWNRRIVAARTSLLAGDANAAGDLLEVSGSLASPPNQNQEAALLAARIRLCVDIPTELMLFIPRGRHNVESSEEIAIERLENDRFDAFVRSTLAPWDLTVPALRRLLGGRVHSTLPPAPENPEMGAEFAARMDELREMLLGRYAGIQRSVSSDSLVQAGARGPERRIERYAKNADPTTAWMADRLADLSVRRWRIVSDSRFLGHVQQLVRERTFVDQLELAVVATLAALHPELRFADGKSLAITIASGAMRAGATPSGSPRSREMLSVVEDIASLGHMSQQSLQRLQEAVTLGMPIIWKDLPDEGWISGENAIVLFLLGPDPLEELERLVLGLPEMR